MKHVVWKSALWLCLCLGSTPLWAATPIATVTIADGEVLLIRDATRLQVAEGVRLVKDDIVETSAKGRLVRIEFSDGVIVDLGPESRALLAPKLTGERARLPARLHLLRGVAKLTVPQTSPPVTSFTSPGFDVTSVARSAVFIVQPDQVSAFAEAGEVALQERSNGKAGNNLSLKSGEFYLRTGDAKASIAPLPSQAFIKQLPRAFLDTLPSRANLYKSREVDPKPLGEITFGDVEAWVDAEGFRSQFAVRWKPLAHNPAFRNGLIANLSAHPEWDRTLYPEKYLPKPASRP